MWQHELGDDMSVDVETLRAWLRPRDRNLQTLVKNRVHAPGHRDEYTCEWFQRHLLDFSRSKDDGLAIVGPAGCGKSVLSHWIIERLQRPLGKKTYETLFFTIGRSISLAFSISSSIHEAKPIIKTVTPSLSDNVDHTGILPSFCCYLIHISTLVAFKLKPRYPITDVYNRSRRFWRDFLRCNRQGFVVTAAR